MSKMNSASKIELMKFDELLVMMDDKKLPMAQGVDISFLSVKEQKLVLELINEFHLIPTMFQTAEMKELSQKGMLNHATLMQVIFECPTQKWCIVQHIGG